jgi:leucyl aminopeptidase (aminopeptidase T)
MLTSAIREIFRTNLGVKRGEKVLVFTDRPTQRDALSEADRERWLRLRDVVMLVYETGRGFTQRCILHVYPSRGGHGMEPPGGLWKAAFGEKTVQELKEKRLLGPIIRKKIDEERLSAAERIIRKRRRSAARAVVALSNYSTSHTRFRDFLTRLCGTRYASMPLFDVSMFEGPMHIDWRELGRRTRKIAGEVRGAYELRITTPAGTDLRVSKKRRKTYSDTGNLRRPGSFGNLPAGEVFFAPVEGSAEGRLVLEWGPTRPFKDPLILEICEGKAVDVKGKDDYRDVLLGKFSEREENRNIAEVGIGTNDKARRPDNILESEKILGTVHVALGDNSSFGGRVKTPFHQDFVLFHPTVILRMRDGKERVLMKEGKLLEYAQRANVIR